ncbi:Flp pilus assembly complex ATPase component TadA, partial [bacterium]|nr:Flp pilus assembly complex ATPase component TadA [bacterium]
MIDKIDYSEPLKNLLEDQEITEILICKQNEIWYEKKGKFFKHSSYFESLVYFQNFIHLLCDESSIQFNYEHPFADGHWRGFRVHICSPPISTDVTITLRRLKPNHIDLEQLQKTGWCSPESLALLAHAISHKKNILVVGSTGSGKTTLLNSLVALAATDRCVFIEDTSELLCPNLFSQKLLTRKDYQGSLPEITQSDLLKQSLRMRPDRLIVGEVRGGEAKDLLMALSTGHGGSMTSLHAGSAAEALLRLEMLVQMGAPQWSLSAIRRLIQLTIDCIVVTKKDKDRWRLDGIYKIASLESF